MTGTVLLTGGTGKTSSRIADKLRNLDIPVLLTSRKGQTDVHTDLKTVTFDWYDEATHPNPFNEDESIDTIYIVVPPSDPVLDRTEVVKKFIDFAREKGVKRFFFMSQLHAYLDSIGVDYAVLRPSWFFGNFLTMSSIKTDDEFITATGTGKVGFIAEDDIADIAVDFLAAPQLGGAERIIVGPELLSYDEIAEQLSRVLGRKITHRSVSIEVRKEAYLQAGVPEQVAAMLSFVEASFIATGSEEQTYNNTPDNLKSIGKIRFIEFAESNKAAWQK